MRATAPRRGFTLVELIAVMSVLAAVGSVASMLIYSAVDAYRAAASRSVLHEDTAAAMARLAIELRQIPLDSAATSTTSPLISVATTSSLAWGTGSGLSLSGSNLRLTVGGIETTLLSNVTGLTIQYYDESNVALAAPLTGSACQAIRRISVTLDVARDGQTDTLRSKFFIRSAMAGGVP